MKVPKNRDPTLLQVCQQIRYEDSPIIYRHANFLGTCIEELHELAQIVSGYGPQKTSSTRVPVIVYFTLTDTEWGVGLRNGRRVPEFFVKQRLSYLWGFYDLKSRRYIPDSCSESLED